MLARSLARVANWYAVKARASRRTCVGRDGRSAARARASSRVFVLWCVGVEHHLPSSFVAVRSLLVGTDGPRGRALTPPPADHGVVRSAERGPSTPPAPAAPIAPVGSRRRDRWSRAGRTARPLTRDDGVELRPEQLLIGAHQLEELVIKGAREPGPVIASAGPCSRCGEHGASPPGQALMACWPAGWLLISILRGFACSATGIFSVSTPAS